MAEPTIDILNELRELSPLLSGMEKVNVFSVPSGYFQSLEDSILVACKNKPGIITQAQKRFPSDIPDGYFDQLAGSILSKIKSLQLETAVGELRSLSPLLYSIQGDNVFEAPKGYFDTLATETLQKAQPKKAKVTAMHTRRLFVRYASAAMIIGFVTLGVFRFTDRQSPVTAVVASTLDSYIQQGKSMNDQQFNNALDNLSADDIASYLEKNGNESDIAALASNLDDSNLPSQDDYLLDEKALENYLSDNNAKQTDN